MTARQFLAAHPGSWIQYYDETPAKNPAEAISARSFDPVVARRKQRDGCAVGLSLQSFGDARIKDQLLCYRTLGVDIDLIGPLARATLPALATDERKERHLRTTLAPFPLTPHWVIETRHGFHLQFRVQPQREPTLDREAEALNRQLCRC